MSDLWAALALMLVLEGLFLFAAPAAWRRMVEQMRGMPDAALRRFGGFMVAIGLLALYLVRSGVPAP
ncbi:MAG: DUF2065 family protein [Xanthomonadales bacterium]|nr:DUF2065 family protein [Xanthomonadales bacterium]